MILIEGGTIWTGIKGSRRKASVLLEGTKIKGIYAPDEMVPATREMTRLDATGCLVMPGLFDLHTHITGNPSNDRSYVTRHGHIGQAVQATAYARQFLSAGITSIRDVGAPPGADLAVKGAVEAGIIPGPRMFVSGQAITMTGGHGCSESLECDGVDEVRRGVRLQIKRGADNIKFMTSGNVIGYRVKPGSVQLGFDEIRAGVIEADNAGKPTAAHSSSAQPIKNCVRAGIGSIEHGIYLDDEGIELMCRYGTVYVPTLVAPYFIAKVGAQSPSPFYDSAKAETVLRAHREGLLKAYKAGVPIGVGTDAGAPFNFPGTVVTEIEHLVDAGIDLEDALVGATSLAAKVCRYDDLVGTLEAGKLADVVIFEGCPWKDISALSRPKAVFKSGKREI